MGMSDLNERLNQLEQRALNFLFPRRCPFCNQHIGNKELICAGCEKKLPYTGDRAVRQTSWGRVAAPLYYEDAVRRANVLGAYEAVHPERIAGKRFLLVDDICTTGSTLGEAARVLRQAGAADVLGLTLAVTREE